MVVVVVVVLGMVLVLMAGFTEGGGVSKAASLLAAGRVAPLAGANHIIHQPTCNTLTLADILTCGGRWQRRCIQLGLLLDMLLCGINRGRLSEISHGVCVF